MSLAKLGKPGNKKGAILSEETKLKLKERSGKAKAIVMFNNKNEIIANFLSIQIASEITGIHRNSISRCARGIIKFIIKDGIPYRFEYQKTKK
jgi:hypothetical protein